MAAAGGSYRVAALGACNGALVEDLFGRYSGSDGALDLNEAKELAGDVLGRTFNAK